MGVVVVSKVIFKMDLGNGLIRFRFVEEKDKFIFEKHVLRSLEIIEFNKDEYTLETAFDEVINAVRKVRQSGEANG